jgi:nitrogenase molybdenum-cofactor synthesis protein NifE
MIDLLAERRAQIHRTGTDTCRIRADRPSLAGSVSQRACVFCGSRVVLYPIADALHLIHGPIGCASYTWDIRGSLSSGPALHRLSFSTDLQEEEVIYGGEKKLYEALCELIDAHAPKAAFVYATCIIGVIGDDVEAVCKRVSLEKGIDVIPVHSEGFKGTKKTGYQAACDALFKLVGSRTPPATDTPAINILGDFNLAGEIWIVKEYYRKMGVRVQATVTGDGRIDEIRCAHGADLNVVQCSGSMITLAHKMKAAYGIPFKHVSYFGIEDMSRALYEVADFFGDPEIKARTTRLVSTEVRRIVPILRDYRDRLQGKRAAIYTGGAFKAFSLVRSLRTLGMKTVMAGSQTGSKDDYTLLTQLCDPDTVILDDTNPLELAKYVQEQKADLFIGGVKERPIAYKLGVGFCDHNHERKIPLAGYDGMVNFAREVAASVTSPVWSMKGPYQSALGEAGR